MYSLYRVRVIICSLIVGYMWHDNIIKPIMGYIIKLALSSKELKFFGFGILRQCFYAFDILKIKLKWVKPLILLQVLEGEASEENLDIELNILVTEKWDFKVRKVDKWNDLDPPNRCTELQIS